VDVLAEKEVSRLLSLWMLAPAGANVVMQLSRPEVARGVLESPVREGSLRERPFKRTRTTLAYVGLALMGTHDERVALRRSVDQQHRQVRASEPLPYNAFRPDLQLWVAACMYVGLRDGYRVLYGEPTATLADRHYDHASRFATTLQVPEHLWPEDRAAFEQYWRESLTTLATDDDTVQFCDDLVHLRFWPPLFYRLGGRAHARLSRGFLAPEFRALFGWEWTAQDQEWFDRATRRMRSISRLLPPVVWSVPLRLVVAHARWRIRRGRAVTG
jgi:uncharacterized protein (DUF2236 family)